VHKTRDIMKMRLVHLLICSHLRLCNVASNDRMISEQQIRKDVKRNCDILIWGIIPSFYCRDQGKPRKSSVKKACVWGVMWTRNLVKTKQDDSTVMLDKTVTSVKYEYSCVQTAGNFRHEYEMVRVYRHVHNFSKQHNGPETPERKGFSHWRTGLFAMRVPLIFFV
jgi:hypothetical protein